MGLAQADTDAEFFNRVLRDLNRLKNLAESKTLAEADADADADADTDAENWRLKLQNILDRYYANTRLAEADTDADADADAAKHFNNFSYNHHRRYLPWILSESDAGADAEWGTRAFWFNSPEGRAKYKEMLRNNGHFFKSPALSTLAQADTEAEEAD